MKMWTIIAAGVLVVFAAGAIVIHQLPERVPLQLEQTRSASHPENILGVEELVRNTDDYRGQVQVEGVVSAIDPE